ncbi:sorting and assembly machinery component 50 homolog [Sitophilus oryzae]|uniref:Sorting and assembly machinery component 50 homolog n=1 Tax=Sitophilus oryzae TaxID=7048 RepID=A0A6J2YGD4_SITOR|nr:sorting and assembly machinery component 50 homolog [Sitophilus oryzae]
MGVIHAKVLDETATNIKRFSKQTGIAEPLEKPDIREVDLENIQVTVDKINVDGLTRTKDDIIEDCIKDLFQAQHFQEVLLKAHKARIKLEELGCFKNIGVYIDVSKGPKARSDGLEVTFDVKEQRRVTGGVTTHIGNNEGVLLVGLRLPNLFGRGEKIQLEYSHGSKKTSNFNCSFIKPFRGKYRPTLTAAILQNQSEWPNSGYKQQERGILFDLGFYSNSLFKHNLQWEGIVRNLSTLTRTTSFDVREQSGVSLKSSFKHLLSIDLRDDHIFPNTGSFVQLTSELAGIGGDVGFLKNEVSVQDNYYLFDGHVLQASFIAGYLSSISNTRKISIADRCYLGGPLSVRGFETRGVGPHSDGDALGTNSYWAAGLHLFTPLPFRPGRGGFGELFRTHFFLNAGNVGNFNLVKMNKSDIIQVLISNVRISYGVGVALKLGNIARLEVNYCFPYKFDKGDQTHPGIQFGIGVQFL